MYSWLSQCNRGDGPKVTWLAQFQETMLCSRCASALLELLLCHLHCLVPGPQKLLTATANPAAGPRALSQDSDNTAAGPRALRHAT